ncbi:glycosyl hydrolase [Cellulomonas marina]|uniref:Glycosyl hydrolase family 26 n=1 Tax=Cellulomonas marina TaxID=988821 RepID=A0A1I0X0Z6_9CELL|nr:glycosyl hydrolase [Cellulomonas marina]GIG29361.1 hypothetical protein Cma02nite_19610 [Cellulomonas marina]SFA94504.1 Glycosyl hydrolase family 26 [Cellulomonas marina]
MQTLPSTRLRAALTRLAPPVALTIALAAGLTGVVTGPAAVTAEAASTPVLSGAYRGSGVPDLVQQFGTWRGRPAGVVTDFVDGSSWEAMENASWVAGKYKGLNLPVALGVPMLPATGGTLQQGATGAFDGHFAALGRSLVANGAEDAILRVGWEMNGTWFRWSAVPDPAAYRNYWIKIVKAMRAVPGQAFRFEWAPQPGAGTKGFDKTLAYPGDAYVDVIGMSLYDQSWGVTSAQHVERWNGMVTMAGGLQWSVDFAAAHGKRNSLPEWGLSKRCDGRGGNDNPYFVAKVSEWVNTHDYLYESYFDKDMGSCEVHKLVTGPFTAAKAEYIKHFGPTHPVYPSPDASVVKVSTKADRSGAVALSGRTVTGKVYVFAQPTFATTKVRFYLDDLMGVRTPLQVEGQAPYDLRGGTATAATAWDVTALPAGPHTMTVVFETSTGTRSVAVAFRR